MYHAFQRLLGGFAAPATGSARIFQVAAPNRAAAGGNPRSRGRRRRTRSRKYCSQRSAPREKPPTLARFVNGWIQ
jgi:hypothetical protein